MFRNVTLLNCARNSQEVKYFSSVITNKDICTGQRPNNWHSAKPFDSIPGPKPIPVIGNLWRFVPGIGNYAGLKLYEVLSKYNEEFGDIMLLRGLKMRRDLLFVFNSKDTETIYRNEGAAPLRDILNSIKYYRLTMRKDLFGNFGGIFTADGEEWMEARSKINPILMQPRAVKLYSEPLDTIAQEMVDKIRYLASKNPDGEMPGNFFLELNKWALESISYMAFNKRLGLLDINLDPKSEKYQFITNTLQFFDLLYEIDIKPNLTKYFSTPLWRKYIKLLDELSSYIKSTYEDSAKYFDPNSNKPQHELSILEKFMKDHKELAFGMIFDMMLGGVDTTSRAAAAFLYYMAKSPRSQQILQEELKHVLKHKTDAVTWQKLEEMPYLRACIKETFRLAPVALGTSRITAKDLVLSGYQVPKRTEVLMALHTMSMSATYFESPTEFIPERWLRDNATKTNTDPWIVLPFGFGVRSCIGKRFATLELETFAAKFMRNFHVTWPHKDMTFNVKILYGIADPLKIRVTNVV